MRLSYETWNSSNRVQIERLKRIQYIGNLQQKWDVKQLSDSVGITANYVYELQKIFL